MAIVSGSRQAHDEDDANLRSPRLFSSQDSKVYPSWASAADFTSIHTDVEPSTGLSTFTEDSEILHNVEVAPSLIEHLFRTL